MDINIFLNIFVYSSDQIKAESLHSETDIFHRIYLAFMPVTRTLLGNKSSNDNNMKSPQNLDCHLPPFFVCIFFF